MAYSTPFATIPREKLKLVKRIAHGGFGTVYKAIWEDQVVAAKRVEREEGERELKFLSELKHPNIVMLLGVVDNEVDVDIILEFCDGGSLRDYLDEHRRSHLGQRFYEWAKQGGIPIAYLKEMGVVHKDIKSSNYLITNCDILKLCDFGLAKELDATMTSATERASYPWMAPELLKDSVLSPTYDIFAYGVVVWELWTTDIPYEGCEHANLVWRICHNDERLPIPLDCPKPIADLMRQCWSRDWKKRPNMTQVLSMVQATEFHGPWELESEFGHEDGPANLKECSDIAVCPNGDIAVVAYLTNAVCVYSNKNVYKFHLDLKLGMVPGVTPHPWNVAVNTEGTIYVTCNQYVLMYTAQSNYKGRWVAMSPDYKPSDSEDTWLRGLTLTHKGHLLVGQMWLRNWYISKHRQDGSHIGSFKVNIRPYYLAATSNDTTVISDAWVGDTVQIIDSTGHLLHTLNSKVQVQVPYWNPWGISCSQDAILVCNTDFNNISEISCFSVSAAEYLGSISVKGRPLSVILTEHNSKLLVTCHDRVMVYRNKLWD